MKLIYVDDTANVFAATFCSIVMIGVVVSMIGCCAPQDGARLPTANVVYELEFLPEGQAGWVRWQDFEVNERGFLCASKEADVYYTHSLALKNCREDCEYCYVVLKKDKRYHVFMPQEQKTIVFFQGEETEGSIRNQYLRMTEFHATNMSIQTLEQTIREELITENLVAKITP